jgi:hypothetical protein
MIDDSSVPLFVFVPIEPSRTATGQLEHIDLDLKAERSSEGSTGPDEGPASGERLDGLWQSVSKLMIAGAPRGVADGPSRTRMEFLNVIFFEFTEWEFEANESSFTDHTDGALFDISNLPETLFRVDKSRPLQPYGAFCLWYCRDSPLVRELLRFGRTAYVRALRDEMGHYHLAFDELGSIDIVARAVKVTSD